MFSAEGFTGITYTSGLDGPTVSAAAVDATTNLTTVGGKITSSPGNVEYTFPAGYNIADGTGVPPTYTCGGDKVVGVPVIGAADVGPLSATTVGDAYPCLDKAQCTRATTAQKAMCPGGATKAKTDSSYCAGSVCANTDFSDTNAVCCTALTLGTSVCPAKETATAAIKTQNDTCGDYKKYKTVVTGTTYEGVAGITSPTYLENCCEDNCTAAKCDAWNYFPCLWSCESPCEAGELWDTYCKKLSS